jgi:hypothetical protein
MVDAGMNLAVALAERALIGCCPTPVSFGIARFCINWHVTRKVEKKHSEAHRPTRFCPRRPHLNLLYLLYLLLVSRACFPLSNQRKRRVVGTRPAT